jgi:hypothetical protein
MKVAPLFTVFFGYWYLGQPQIFENRAVAKDYLYSVEITDHRAANITVASPEFPLFVCSMVFTFCLILEYLGLFEKIGKRKELSCLGLHYPPAKFYVDEGLGRYYETLPYWVKRIMYTE